MISRSGKDNPCFGCTDRKEGCAVGCERYAEMRRKNEEVYAENKKRVAEYEAVRDAVYRTKKRAGLIK